jgi:chorismate mutase
MNIERWREEIDQLDEELLRLLNMRARLAIKVGTLKRASGIPVRDLERERFVLERLQEANTGPLDSEAVVRLFRRIIRESRRAEALAVKEVGNSSVSQLNSTTKLRGIA